jgi:hypothetical protein
LPVRCPVPMVGAVCVPMAVMVVSHGATVATPRPASEIAMCPSGAGHLIHNSYRSHPSVRRHGQAFLWSWVA